MQEVRNQVLLILFLCCKLIYPHAEVECVLVVKFQC